ncbi:MAG: DUF2298 domain-containing protein, partial [Patescibacteria group bacterium]
ILNLGGNLHTIYIFTKGYENESPVPFWKIMDSLNSLKYWYPNATRFIPFTIHEFPSYSYVVADLHGHVFDIPFVLLTLAVLFHMIYSHYTPLESEPVTKPVKNKKMQLSSLYDQAKTTLLSWKGFMTIFLGFMCAVHYMTNAFDGPIYILLSSAVLLLLNKLSVRFFMHFILLCISYLIFSHPFSAHFSLFVAGIGVNCPPAFIFNNATDAQTTFTIGPLLFEKGNCQKSPFWMMFVLWGFFWINFLILLFINLKERHLMSYLINSFKMLIGAKKSKVAKKIANETNTHLQVFDLFALLIFCFSTFLLFIPEFFYVKDIYPAHFRANTMFKLGYQSFMMMSIASTYVIYRVKLLAADHPRLTRALVGLIFMTFFIVFQYAPRTTTDPTIRAFHLEFLFIFPLVLLFLLIFMFRREKNSVMSFIFSYILTNLIILICIYPFFSFPSYYTNLQKKPTETGLRDKTSLDGQEWLKRFYPSDLEIVNYINSNIKGQPVILEAQGDSYTDYERISANTGLPTVAGWWVHEWLWRGTSDIVGKRIPDIANIYESGDTELTRKLLKKYYVKYVVISGSERSKYPNLNTKKFDTLGTKIFQSTQGFGALYQVN